MAWLLGIDEAGYGPNLGPFVMTLVGCRVPDDLLRQPECNLWELLQPVVRRGRGKDDGRLLIDDSKVVHAGTRGLARLEQGVLATLGLPGGQLADLLSHLCPDDRDDLAGEVWYTGTSAVPGHVDPLQLTSFRERFQKACAGVGIQAWHAVSVVVCPRRFNQLVAAAGSKSAVPAYALARLLLVGLPRTEEDEAIHIWIDKQGGRHSYAPQLQQGLPRGLVVVVEEKAARSAYQVKGLPCSLHFAFEPKADGKHFPVALASMTSKYLRELFMGEFNRFWQAQVPDLKPTAGYPVDAARFFQQVREAAERLAIAEVDLWRQR